MFENLMNGRCLAGNFLVDLFLAGNILAENFWLETFWLKCRPTTIRASSTKMSKIGNKSHECRRCKSIYGVRIKHLLSFFFSSKNVLNFEIVLTIKLC